MICENFVKIIKFEKGEIMGIERVENFINGEFSKTSLKTMDIINPASAKVIASVVLSGENEVKQAVKYASKAQKSWSALTYKQRSAYFYTLLGVIKNNRDILAKTINLENGKNLVDSNAEVDKAIELCEFAVSIAQDNNHYISEVSKGIICSEQRRPLGIVCSISPSNFPVMVAFWTILNAIMMGNAMILKPSEVTPMSASNIANLFNEAGFPKGLFSVIHGAREAVEAVCDNENIQAISFVGSTPVAKIVYKRATSNLKRALCLGGAKNFLLLAPDAEPKMAVNDIIASFSGMNGQRCMAASVLVVIGDCEHIISEIVKEVKKLGLNENLSPIISKVGLDNLTNYLEQSQKAGAKVLVDGREYKTNREGFFVAPSILDFRDGGKMEDREIFGSILEIVSAKNLNEAIEMQNNSPYGNGASIYTQNGKISEDAIRGLTSGMLGVNIGIPVPREPFSFGGIKDSKFGYGDINGKSSLDFWSHLTKITTKYSGDNKIDCMS
jgi:malonate-semialdehyde dehydrogenase (acetylating)/methylmalonate-semialdehyde dehydrogenase